MKKLTPDIVKQIARICCPRFQNQSETGSANFCLAEWESILALAKYAGYDVSSEVENINKNLPPSAKLLEYQLKIYSEMECREGLEVLGKVDTDRDWLKEFEAQLAAVKAIESGEKDEP